MEILVVIISGFVGGFVGAQVGAGAMVTLPALLFLGISPVLAIGTNVLSGWLINVAAVVKFWKSKKIDFKLSVPISIISLIGAVLGSNIILSIDIDILKRVVVVFFIILLVLLFVKPKSNDVKSKLSLVRLWFSYVLSFILGFYGGFFSVGVATFLIFMLTLLLKKNLVSAVANSIFITAIMMSGATLVFILKDNIDYTLAVPLALASMAGAYMGASTALKLGDKWLKFMIFFIVIAIVVKLMFF